MGTVLTPAASIAVAYIARPKAPNKALEEKVKAMERAAALQDQLETHTRIKDLERELRQITADNLIERQRVQKDLERLIAREQEFTKSMTLPNTIGLNGALDLKLLLLSLPLLAPFVYSSIRPLLRSFVSRRYTTDQE